MAFTEFESAVNERALTRFLDQKRPPVHIRPQLDFGYMISGHTVDIVEIRPDWKDKSKLRQTAFARVKFVRTREQWLLYWMRGNLKWYAYEPDHVHHTLESALKTVAADENCCFFG
jgi:hypothetical protein